MNQAPLTLERFGELVAAYGAEVEHFPVEHRAAARALLAESEKARALLEAERELDRELALLPEPTLEPGLRERLERIPARAPQRGSLRRAWPVAAFGWVAAAAIGLFIGAQSQETTAAVGSAGTAVEEDSTATLLGMPALEDEDTGVALALGSFAELEEEP